VVGSHFYRVSVDRLLARLSPGDQESLSRYIEHDLVGLRQFVREHFSPEIAEYRAAVSSRFQQVYEEKLSQIQNQLIVFPFLRSAGKPLIPGSSLKGALRTAILNHLLRGSIPDNMYADTLEAQTLDYMGERRPDIPRDPLKGLRLMDIALPAEEIVAERIETWQKDAGQLKEVSIQIHQEVTTSVLTGQELSLTGEIRIYDGFLNQKTAPMKQGIRWLAEACNAFYTAQVLTAEEKYFQGVSEVEKVYQRIRAEISPNSFLLRIGWGSGLNSVSLNLRAQKPRQVKTRKLIDGRLPLGWAKITVKEMNNRN
jgi:CRISPR type III-A-associated RAMP protein Csm5